ncbi:alpha/beta fold hydrolase [Halalkalicoccus jeotgali]|uniref:Alpha/beta hydrolase fold protein n=1 Tax=Halalkalicoccus jeotgali (strain DSM 18796 / CECT 7217 / JCM 14584 / KCTC 4019 / B3) TaxID=795797 RepID=D8J291_HALJB|nr:alpha/beta hydrolase [Halalkalicoccus jeotgali]ADJ14848.1 alpha/beta hydrolase fold protein [Halalkalicoccus jeotgali B3]ELY39430.1 alpha/beta hydrolase fold protein [Halalkalicoccus jeotgali B3]
MDWSHGEAIVNGLRLHYVEAGEGPLVVLLHGFPDHWYGWREQIPALVEAGYRVVAPDMRGYNRSEKPPGVSAYRIGHLIEDVRELIAHFGAERAHLVGHDWGGVVAWEVAARYPDSVDRLVVLNAPHPSAYRRELRDRESDQRRRSWYVLLFQLPWLPELLVRFGRQRLLGALFRGASRSPEAFDEEAIERYTDACTRPGAMSAMLNYYRALFRGTLGSKIPGQSRPCSTTSDGLVGRPTLLLWGTEDEALSPALTEGLEEWVPDIEIERVAGAGHWVQLDATDRVNESLVGFLNRD